MSVQPPKQRRPIYPLIFDWPFRTCGDLWLKWGSLLQGEYPWNWFLAEFLSFMAGLNFALATGYNPLLVGLTAEAIGFLAYYFQRDMYPWPFAIAQSVHGAAAGTMIGLFIRFLAFLGRKMPSMVASGGIIGAVLGMYRKGENMKAVPPMSGPQRAWNNLVAVLIILASAAFLIRQPHIAETARWAGVALAVASLANAVQGKYTFQRRVVQGLLSLAVGVCLLCMPYLQSLLG